MPAGSKPRRRDVAQHGSKYESDPYVEVGERLRNSIDTVLAQDPPRVVYKVLLVLIAEVASKSLFERRVHRSTIARKAGLSERSTSKALKWLHDAGAITWHAGRRNVQSRAGFPAVPVRTPEVTLEDDRSGKPGVPAEDHSGNFSAFTAGTPEVTPSEVLPENERERTVERLAALLGPGARRSLPACIKELQDLLDRSHVTEEQLTNLERLGVPSVKPSGPWPSDIAAALRSVPGAHVPQVASGLMARNQRRAAGEDCPECSDTGLVLNDAGDAYPCACSGKAVA